MAEEEVGLRTTLKDRRQTAAGLRDIEGGLDRVGRSAQTAGTRARMASRGFESMRRSGRLAGNAIRLGFVSALGAGYAAVRLLRSSFEEAREAQKVGALTRSTIKSTGAAANVTGRQVERLSTRLSQMAGIDDELVQSGGNVLLTFKNVRNEMGKNNKIFNQATKSAVDLSTTPLLNGNITGASKMLGKALNDPLKGIAALTKAGVQFTEGQVDQITRMVEQNNLLGAQKIILGEVNSQVGGAAKAQRTWGDVADVTFKNILERVGVDLLPMLDRFNKWFSTDGAKNVDHYLDAFEDRGVPALQHFADQAIPLARRVLPKVAGVLGTIRDVVVDAAPYAERLIDAFNNMPDWAKKGIAGAGVAGYLGNKTGVFSGLGSLLKGGKGIGGLASSAKPVPVFVTNPGFSKGGLPIPGADDRRTSITSKVASAAAVAATEVAVAAIATGGIFKLQDWLAPDSTLIGMNPDQGQGGGPSATPGQGIDTFGQDQQGTVGLSNLWKDPFAGLSLGASNEKLFDTAPIFAYEQSLQSLQRTGLSPLDAIMDDVNSKTGFFDTVLGQIGQKKPAPTFTTPGLDQSRQQADDYKGLLDKVGKPVSTKVTANTSTATTAVDNLAQHIRNVLSSAATTVSVAVAGLNGRAAGGPVAAGQPYVVGEHRPELFVPRVDGYILPRVPGGYRAGGMDVDDFEPGEGTGRAPAVTVVKVMVGERELTQVTLEGFETIGARR